MLDQAALIDKGIEFELRDCEVPGDGSLKSHNWPPDEIQREKLKQLAIGSHFKITVTMITCVHGTMSLSDPTPASLLVFQYHFTCTKKNHVFDAVDTDFNFDLDAVRNFKKTTSESRPNVIAFAPFRIPEKFEITMSEIRKKLAADLKSSLGFSLGSVDGDISKEKEETHQQKYFAQGQGDVIWDVRSKRNYGVWWNVRHNESQENGIPSILRTAILLKRDNDKPFRCRFSCVVAGGLCFEVKQKILGLLDPDDDILFDPTAQPQGILKEINRNELGNLRDGKELDGLSFVSGLEPLQPRK